MPTTKKATAKAKTPRVAKAPPAAPATPRSPVGPFCLPLTSTVKLAPANGGWAQGCKGGLFAARCIGTGATVATVIANAAKAGITAAQAKAHLMWAYNHTWLVCSPAPAGVPPLGAPQRGRGTNAQTVAAATAKAAPAKGAAA